MRILKTEFDKRGYHFRQIWRDEEYAIYEQTKNGTVHYETIKILIGKDREMAGVEIEGGEMYPSDKQWVTYGFTLFTREQAFDKVEELKLRDDKNKKDKNVEQ